VEQAMRRDASARTRCRRDRRAARRGADAAATDWAQIAALYDVLMRIEPTPIVELNRAVAVAMRDGADAGLALIDAILARGELESYHLAHAARADLPRSARTGARTRDRGVRAGAGLARLEPERRFLERKLGELRARNWRRYRID
jgi:RNA polymerase sigma-70 factor (ECF subfamily)